MSIFNSNKFCLPGPLVVAFWRGTWGFYDHILDHVLFEENTTYSNSFAFIIGFIATLIVDLFHHNMSSFARSPGTLRHNILRHLFSIIWGILDILYWKGIWDQIDNQAGYGVTQVRSEKLYFPEVKTTFLREIISLYF